MSRHSQYGLVVDHLEEFYPEGDLPPVIDVMSALGMPRMTAHRHVKTYSAETGRAIGKTPKQKPEHPESDNIEADIHDGKTLDAIRRDRSLSLAVVKEVVNRRGLAPLVSQQESAHDEIYDLIARFHRSTGRPPSHKEVERRSGLSPQSVKRCVTALVRLGKINGDSNRHAISLHGSSFAKDCQTLAIALRDGEGIPESHRPTVVRLVMPVLAPDRRVIQGRSAGIRTTAAVEHLSARLGRPVTAADLSQLARCSWSDAETALRAACSRNLLREMGNGGYLSTAPDARLAAARALRDTPAQGWRPETYEALQRVLGIVVW